MPELPDVETFRRIAAKCVGRTVRRVSVDDPGMLKGVSHGTLQRLLKDARIASAARHGKHLFLALATGCLAMHFGTNGSLRLLREGEAEPRFVRFHLVLAEGDRLAYLNPRRIGEVRWAKNAESFIAEARLGPDALDRRFDLMAFRELVEGRKRDVKSILMDQQSLAGIGNIYSDEILFQARIHPAIRGEALAKEQIQRLFKSIKQVLKTAVARGAARAAGSCGEGAPASAPIPRRARSRFAAPRA